MADKNLIKAFDILKVATKEVSILILDKNSRSIENWNLRLLNDLGEILEDLAERVKEEKGSFNIDKHINNRKTYDELCAENPGWDQ